MKRKIIFFTILIINTFCFAQYRETVWNENLETFLHSKEVIKGDNLDKFIEYKEPKLIMGEASSFSYIFRNDKLKGIAYEISYTENTLNSLLEKMSKYPYKILGRKKANFTVTEEMLKQSNKKYNLKLLSTEDVIDYKIGGNTIIGDILKSEEPTSTNSELILVSYTGTDVYIYSNIFEGKIIVVYTEHEDDF